MILDDVIKGAKKHASKFASKVASTSPNDVIAGGRTVSKKLKDTVTDSAIREDAMKFAKGAKDNGLFRNRAEKLNRRVASQNAKNVSLNETFNTSNYIERAGRSVATMKPKPYNIVNPALSNAYTGYELKSGVDTALAAGALGITAGVSAVKANTVDTKGHVRSENVGPLPSLSYDAAANASAGKRDLGATGDLVFGLHNQRRG